MPKGKKQPKKEAEFEIKQTVTVQLGRKLMKEIKHYAIDHNKKVSSVFDEALKEYLKRRW